MNKTAFCNFFLHVGTPFTNICLFCVLYPQIQNREANKENGSSGDYRETTSCKKMCNILLCNISCWDVPFLKVLIKLFNHPGFCYIAGTHWVVLTTNSIVAVYSNWIAKFVQNERFRDILIQFIKNSPTYVLYYKIWRPYILKGDSPYQILKGFLWIVIVLLICIKSNKFTRDNV